MSSTQTQQARQFLAAVEAACADLDPAERSRLVGGLEEHLSELSADGVDLTAELVDGPGRHGNSALLTLLHRTAGGALSEAERLFHAVLRRAGLTGWVANAAVRVQGRTVAVVDVLFEQARVIVEVDGWGAHGDRESFERDRRRQNALVTAGYLVLRFTWNDLQHRPDAVVTEVRAALRRRGA